MLNGLVKNYILQNGEDIAEARLIQATAKQFYFLVSRQYAGYIYKQVPFDPCKAKAYDWEFQKCICLCTCWVKG